MTVPAACEQVPWEGSRTRTSTPAGRVSVRTTAVGARGPGVLDRERVGEHSVDQHRVRGVRLRDREVRDRVDGGGGARGVVGGTGSATADVTLAVFVIEPAGLRRDLDRHARAGPVGDRAEGARDGAGRLRAAALRRRGRVECHAARAACRVTRDAGGVGGPGVGDRERVGELLSHAAPDRASPSW